jgi:hypothetical protein
MMFDLSSIFQWGHEDGLTDPDGRGNPRIGGGRSLAKTKPADRKPKRSRSAGLISRKILRGVIVWGYIK